MVEAQEDSSAKLAEASKLLLAGDQDKGMPILLGVLDRSPMSVEALDELMDTAEAWPKWSGELFRRIDAVLNHNPPAALAAKLRWRKLAYTIIFDRDDLETALLAAPESVIGGDDTKRAIIGALLAGRQDRRGRELLNASHDILATYHQALLAHGEGNGQLARQLLAKIGGDTDADLLNSIGAARLELERHDGLKKASEVLSTPINENATRPTEKSQLELLRLEVALKSHERQKAERSGYLLRLHPYRTDLNTLVRARSLLGPLTKLMP